MDSNVGGDHDDARCDAKRASRTSPSALRLPPASVSVSPPFFLVLLCRFELKYIRARGREEAFMLPDDNGRRRARSLIHQLDCTARFSLPSLNPQTVRERDVVAMRDARRVRPDDAAKDRGLPTDGSPPTGKPTSASIVPSARRPFPTQAPLARLSAQKNVFVFCPRGRVVRRPRGKSSLREDEKNSSLATRRSSNPRARRLASVARRRERRAARVASFVIRRRRHVRRAPQPPPSSPRPRPQNARLSRHAFRVVCAYDPGAGIIPGVRMYP